MGKCGGGEPSEDGMVEGCYVALNALAEILRKGNNTEEDVEFFVFTRLVETIEHFTKYFDIPFREALLMGNAETFLSKERC